MKDLVLFDGGVITQNQVNEALFACAYNLTATAAHLRISRAELVNYLGTQPTNDYARHNCEQLLEEAMIVLRQRVALGDMEATKLSIQLSCKFLFPHIFR